MRAAGGRAQTEARALAPPRTYKVIPLGVSRIMGTVMRMVGYSIVTMGIIPEKPLREAIATFPFAAHVSLLLGAARQE